MEAANGKTQRAVAIIEQELRRLPGYLWHRFKTCGARDGVPMTRVRIYWVLVHSSRVDTAKFRHRCGLFEAAGSMEVVGNIDDHLLPSRHPLVQAMFEDCKPGCPKTRQLHKAMLPTTAGTHTKLRRILGVPCRGEAGFVSYSDGLPALSRAVLCARERDVLDIWFQVQQLTDEEFAIAKVAVSRARATTWKQLGPLAVGKRAEYGRRFFVQTQDSIWRWPWSLALGAQMQGSQPFDTKIGRIHSSAELLSMMGWRLDTLVIPRSIKDPVMRRLAGEATGRLSISPQAATQVQHAVEPPPALPCPLPWGRPATESTRELLWPILDLLVVAGGFYGSGSSPEMVSIRLGISWGLISGHV